eukprot:6481940-Alexandrium_andersonii.AAC.1
MAGQPRGPGRRGGGGGAGGVPTRWKARMAADGDRADGRFSAGGMGCKRTDLLCDSAFEPT